MNNFNKLNIKPTILQAIESLNYTEMTEIQKEALPYILDGKDIVARAKTGSGKTATFGIGVLNNLDENRFRIQSIILTPTRELASQVAIEIRALAKFIKNIKVITLCGGVPYRPQAHSLSHLAHIVVGTAGRVIKHLEDGNFNCDDINTFVLDEADKMLDMGFYDDIMKIASYLPKERQNMLFSATYPQKIETITRELLENPIDIILENSHNEEAISEKFYICQRELKAQYISRILNTHKDAQSIIIFCNMKIDCNSLYDELKELGYDPLLLSSELEQRDRDETLTLFSNRSYPILIATDVASRGIDIKDIDIVINYDIPTDTEVYTHRIGRTARAGGSGLAISLVNTLDGLKPLEKYLNRDLTLNKDDELSSNTDANIESKFGTIFINGGKRDKLRKGDILGSLIKSIGLEASEIGQIDILYFCSYVAIKRDKLNIAFDGLSKNKIKNKIFRVFIK